MASWDVLKKRIFTYVKACGYCAGTKMAGAIDIMERSARNRSNLNGNEIPRIRSGESTPRYNYGFGFVAFLMRMTR
ncbi:hypothetical protein DF122_36465 [Burkholderia pseudomallei]|uniref:Uncharacterized protein n=2 Tax=Burkholderia pseudomallei TaxID=28450 RepID=A0A0H3HSV2_BURP2|nr:hypothetical protein BP1026B_II0727 [Burkholderia pseudomallei 1026b]ARK46561.1 hypothetical protein BOC35_09740 [Burkholderia pseudomallei]EIF61281.1 hypothetical protein BP1026A_2404 [Burkholderia pseudomallei 1026a]ARK56591.1 hypothetical protein BOC36_26545 [Burkholderia pseudomallei]ARK61097.1 hypothetical protein BOC37_15285 [Burkholderia pseudomallei]